MEIYELFFSENTKQCSKCKEWKDKETGFYKDKNNKDGYRSNCKRCVKQYEEENKEHIKEYRKQYNQENKEHRKELEKQGNQKNKEYKKQRYNSPLEYNSKTKYRQGIELYEEVKESLDGNVMCKCASCDKGFEPTYRQIHNRINAINGTGSAGGESKLYCSQMCKDNCPIYWQHLYTKDQKPTINRDIQQQIAEMVFERDNYTCQKCNIHRDNLEVGIHCHHKEGILGEPLQSADMDMCITLCEDCHKEVHQIPGCGYHEMRCT